jgi:DNA invertase Pin-like site-specific DNA recombinase
MQSLVREGDTVFCHSMDRLARNLDDLRRIVLGLTERDVHIVFVKEKPDLHRGGFAHVESVAECDGEFAQFERELIRERQREGIATAKREGKYHGRKPSRTDATDGQTDQRRCE